jgi:hypothetical protein
MASTGLSVSWGDIDGMRRFSRMLEKLGSNVPVRDALRRGLNHTGAVTKTQVVRVLAKQTGLKVRVIKRAVVEVKRANSASLDYIMQSSGGDIALKHFAAREVRRGVSAAPFGERQTFAGKFMRAGRFPARVSVPKFNGHVFEREGSGRFPIVKVKSGVIIPAEMVKGATADAFRRVVAERLPARVSYELRRLTDGALS